jgi:hypothetical protein
VAVEAIADNAHGFDVMKKCVLAQSSYCRSWGISTSCLFLKYLALLRRD